MAMAAAAFGIKPWQKLIKAVFVTFAVSFFVRGIDAGAVDRPRSGRYVLL